jgi:periplasmic divalent cation tolerance protein
VSAICLVFTTLPNAESAGTLAHHLVETRLAACVNILAPCQSVYRWQGKLQTDGEVPLIIKTTIELYPIVETYLKQHHPYELPEIIALDVSQGLPEYLDWIAKSVGPDQVMTGV